MNDDNRESDGAKLARMGTDATLWAQDMARVFAWNGIKLDPTPGGLLHGWLCGAIEAGRSAGAAQAHREVAQSLPFIVRLHAAESIRGPVSS